MNRGRPLIVTIVALAVAAGVDLAVGAEPFPTYAALVGLVGCVLIVVVSTWLGRVLSRPEDVYPDDVPADTQEDLRG